MLTAETRKRIKTLRLAAGLTVEASAKLAGISSIYWRHLEDGTKKNPSIEVLQRMAQALGCTVADFYAENMSFQSMSEKSIPDQAA